MILPAEEYTLAPQSPRMSYVMHGKEVIGHIEKMTKWRWVLYATPAKTLKSALKSFLPTIKDQRGGFNTGAKAFWAIKHHHTNLIKEAT